MDKRIPIVVAGIFLLIVLGAVGLMIFDETPEPETYVSAQKTETLENFFFEKKINRIPAKGVITPPKIVNGSMKVGVSADRNELHFGILVENMSTKKSLELKNDDRQVKICVVSYGSVAEFIKIGTPDFIMDTGESKNVSLEFRATRLGNFTGEVDVIAKKPKYGFMESLLPYVAC